MDTAQHTSHELLSAWLDHELPASERAHVEAHLASCAACRREAEEIAALRSALAALPLHQPPRSFRLTTEQARAARTAPSPGTIVRLLPAVRALSIAAVMAFFIVSAALLLGPVSHDSGETTSAPETSLSQEAVATGGAPGEIVDQGRAAASDERSLTGLVPAAPMRATVEDDTVDGGRSPLALVTIGTGGLAVVLVAFWIVLAQLSRSRRAR